MFPNNPFLNSPFPFYHMKTQTYKLRPQCSSGCVNKVNCKQALTYERSAACACYSWLSHRLERASDPGLNNVAVPGFCGITPCFTRCSTKAVRDQVCALTERLNGSTCRSRWEVKNTAVWGLKDKWVIGAINQPLSATVLTDLIQRLLVKVTWDHIGAGWRALCSRAKD